MRLDEGRWVLGGGITPEWRAVAARRTRLARAGLGAMLRQASSRGPAAVRRGNFFRGLERLALARGPEAEKILSDPAFDYWLFLWDKHFGAPNDDETWRLHFGLAQGFGVSLCLLAGGSGRFDGVLDFDGHLHLYGSPFYMRFDKALALRPARIVLGPRRLEVRVAGGPSFAVSRDQLDPRLPSGSGILRRLTPVREGIDVQSCGALAVRGVVMHGLARQSRAQEAAFAQTLGEALDLLGTLVPALRAEIGDMIRVLIPLATPKDMSSVSSSYVNMRGAICLSASDDALLQCETLVHEYCHQKMNQLLLADPVLAPGQGGQVFYSPWRADARRLRGLLLGAHAFLNVADCLLRSLREDGTDFRRRVETMSGAGRRLFEVEAALDTVCDYADFSEFGRRFALRMRRELRLLFHSIQWFPPRIVAESRERAARHRAAHALPGTGFHRAADFSLEPARARR